MSKPGTQRAQDEMDLILRTWLDKPRLNQKEIDAFNNAFTIGIGRWLEAPKVTPSDPDRDWYASDREFRRWARRVTTKVADAVLACIDDGVADDEAILRASLEFFAAYCDGYCDKLPEAKLQPDKTWVDYVDWAARGVVCTKIKPGLPDFFYPAIALIDQALPDPTLDTIRIKADLVEWLIGTHFAGLRIFGLYSRLRDAGFPDAAVQAKVQELVARVD